MNKELRIPVSTYRLQFNKGFTFNDAREVVPYLHRLGISDLYASPYFAAKKDSPHGYDIVDHNALNRELGTEEEFQEFCGELQRHGMGQMLDFVPNHMCIDNSDNAWWRDVLENGPCSPYAYFFDIDWEPVKQELRNKVLLPFLGDQYGTVLERGELRLVFEEGAFSIHYFDVWFPVEPTTYLKILEYRLESLEELQPADAPSRQELLSIITALQHLPTTTEQDPDKREERYREKEIVKRRLMQLCGENPAIGSFIADNVLAFNGTTGESASFDLLDGLLGEQVYRLSFWRVATEEINYRRFFDINGLGAIRMEDPAVFRESHVLLLRLIREGKVTGVRIDHVDGLYDPSSYLRRLQKGCFVQLGLAERVLEGAEAEKAEPEVARGYDEAATADPDFKPFYVVGEKILLKGEQLPKEWPVFGTTGYDFLNALNGVFIDTENARAFDRIYAKFIQETIVFPEAVYEKKKLVMQVAMSGEVNTLGHYLNTISEKDRLTRDFTLNSLTKAITEVIAYFPVYRAYTNSWTIRDGDVRYIEAAVAKAKRKNPAISSSVFDFLRDVLLLRFPGHATEGDRMEWLSFVMKFQQITGPVMAKGTEDTAFYVYNRLVSLNEVGGAPDRFGTTLEAFHGQNLERLKSFPHALIASSTHDSKRGEDVRARINALSEIPGKWRKALAAWSQLNKAKKGTLDGRPVPDRNEEYFFYQTLVGAWPVGPMEQGSFGYFRERMREYMVKAVREAKVNSSWTNPNIPYEETLSNVIDAILADGPNPFLAEFTPFQSLIARWGAFSSLSQTLLKITSPGVPDFYRGTELWDLNLVDPDNRRPLDFRSRGKALVELVRREEEDGPLKLVRELLHEWEDGMIKLYLTCKALGCRRENRELFERGEYVPLEVTGDRARNICAFARRMSGKGVVVVAPRFMATLIPEPDKVPCGEEVWGGSFLVLPEGSGAKYRNVLTGEVVTVGDGSGRPVLSLAKLFADVPVAFLESAGDVAM
jgi:(1->4)-alpha-D-glucan 1-alpha-D-glucosylmutase